MPRFSSDHDFYPWDKIPDDVAPGGWITDSLMIFSWGNRVDPILAGRIFETPAGDVFVKVERARDIDSNLKEGIFIQTTEDSAFKHDEAKRLGPGLHTSEKIRKICQRRARQGIAELDGFAHFLWRANIFLNRFHPGVYQFTCQKDYKPVHVFKKLTEADYASLDSYLHSRFEDSLSTQPIDRESAVAAANNLYRAIGLPAPRIAIVSNPVTAELAGPIACVLAAADRGDSSRPRADGMMWSLDRLLNRAWLRAKFDALAERPDSLRWFWREQRLYETLNTRTWTAQPGALQVSVLSAVHDLIQTETTAKSLESARRRAVQNEAPLTDFAIDDLLRRFTHDCTAKFFAGNPVFKEWFKRSPHSMTLMFPGRTMFAEVCYLADVNIFGEQKSTEFEYWSVLRKECQYVWMSEDLCILSDRPCSLRLDLQNGLHNDAGPAIEWRDGVCRYALET